MRIVFIRKLKINLTSLFEKFDKALEFLRIFASLTFW
jgi:hypothetical protein